jgi:hypothetical protein
MQLLGVSFLSRARRASAVSRARSVISKMLSATPVGGTTRCGRALASTSGRSPCSVASTLVGIAIAAGKSAPRMRPRPSYFPATPPRCLLDQRSITLRPFEAPATRPDR